VRETKGPPEGASAALRAFAAASLEVPEDELEALVEADGNGYVLHTRIAEGYIKAADVKVSFAPKR
jgi:hypothetical protein